MENCGEVKAEVCAVLRDFIRNALKKASNQAEEQEILQSGTTHCVYHHMTAFIVKVRGVNSLDDKQQVHRNDY